MTRWRFLAAAAATVLCACGSLDPGQGRAPTGLHIQLSDGSLGSYQTQECAEVQLYAILESDGDGGPSGDDATGRVEWRSSNPGVIDVSAGRVIARTAGSAVITAEFLDFTAHFDVVANALEDLRIEPGLTRLAPGSHQQFALKVTLAGDTALRDVSDIAEWDIASGGTAVESLTGPLLQAASGPLEQPFVLRAHLANCDREATLELALGAVKELRLGYEQPEGLPIPLLASDLVDVSAVFADADAPTQNLADQVSIERMHGDADESQLLLGGESLRLSGLKAATAQQYQLTFEPLKLSALTRSASFADLGLLALRIDPQNLVLRYPDDYTLQALGSFDDGHERPLRRHVSWTTGDTDLVEVTASGEYGGTLGPTGLSGVAAILATTTDADGKVLTADTSVELRSD